VIIINWKDRPDGKTATIPINHDLTMTENVKVIADWLKDYDQKYDIRYIVMYHAAKKTAPVLEQGLLAGNNRRKNFGMSESGYVYLATTPKMAQMFGDIAHNSNYTIYEVIVPVGKLLPDKGRLRHTTPDGAKGSSLAHSLIYAGSAKVKGSIESWQIKRYEDESRSISEKPSFLGKIKQKKQEIASHPTPGVTRKKSRDERS